MLWLLDTGRMAKKFGRWRGLIIVAHAVAVCILALCVSRLADVVINLETTPVSASTLSLAAIVIYGAGVLLGVWGACQYFLDAFRGSHIHDADRYDQKAR